jgi:uncharacterized protein YuzE
MRDPQWDGSDIVLTFGTGAVGETADVVVDIDEGGDILGIEILGLLALHPGLAFPEPRDGGPRVSIDREADAVYIRFAQGRSVNQTVRPAIIALDGAERVQNIRVRMER